MVAKRSLGRNDIGVSLPRRKPCQQCGFSFSLRQYDLNRYLRSRFCSQACRSRFYGRIQGIEVTKRAAARRAILSQPRDHRVIQLSTGEITRVDVEDFAVEGMHHWQSTCTGYAKRDTRLPKQTIRLHRSIMTRVLGRALKSTDQVDHINGDRLDNRRANLRVVSNMSNAWNRGRQANNTSGYKGVSAYAVRGGVRYVAECSANGQRYRKGGFERAADAARQYDAWASHAHGEFARLNFNEASSL